MPETKSKGCRRSDAEYFICIERFRRDKKAAKSETRGNLMSAARPPRRASQLITLSARNFCDGGKFLTAGGRQYDGIAEAFSLLLLKRLVALLLQIKVRVGV